MIERLQAFLRTTAAPGREVLSVPPFTAYLDRRDPLRFLNYAIPDGDLEPDADAIEELRGAFRRRGRLPRLEWIEEAAPRVAPVLAACGLVEELRSPLMACTPDGLVDAPVAFDDLRVGVVSDGDVRESDAVQRSAFGLSPAPEAEPHRRRVLARVRGEPAAAAAWSPVADGVSEIVGVATAEGWRGRGLGGAVTAAAARAAFEAGASLCVLSPGDAVAQRVYVRAGFSRVATMLHWSDPPDS
ncbi:MAG: GNAT family N-acetyltransferase [Gaiellaceae bacterium]